jgi:hypothetical protein
MRIPAQLRGQVGALPPGQVVGHDRCRAAQVGKRGRAHALVADRHQRRLPVGLLSSQQRGRVPRGLAQLGVCGQGDVSPAFGPLPYRSSRDDLGVKNDARASLRSARVDIGTPLSWTAGEACHEKGRRVR